MQRSFAMTLVACFVGTLFCSLSARADETRSTENVNHVNIAQRKAASNEKLAPTTVLDCRLRKGGSLAGQLVDGRGQPIANAKLVLANPKGALGTCRTNARGKFVFPSVNTGTVALLVGQQARTVRVWEAGSAPPIAKDEVLVVLGDAIRAQHCDSGPNCVGCDSCGCEPGFRGHFGGVFQRMLRNPWLVGIGTAAAITIPLATDDDGGPPGGEVPDAS